MKFRLHSLDERLPSFELTLTKSPVRIGRHPGLDVSLDDESVSPFHCQIDQINGTLWVRDLGSGEGIFVNGFNVPQSHLMPGDRLTVGTMSFRVEYERRTREHRAAIADAEVIAAN
jgi:pSer/pThr/pTyr-binding forkhead associated (FHA) protein